MSEPREHLASLVEISQMTVRTAEGGNYTVLDPGQLAEHDRLVRLEALRAACGELCRQCKDGNLAWRFDRGNDRPPVDADWWHHGLRCRAGLIRNLVPAEHRKPEEQK